MPALTDLYSRKNSLQLIELSSVNEVSLAVYVSSCINTGSIRDDPYWTSIGNLLLLLMKTNFHLYVSPFT
jgi:hypothetical protein